MSLFMKVHILDCLNAYIIYCQHFRTFNHKTYCSYKLYTIMHLERDSTLDMGNKLGLVISL